MKNLALILSLFLLIIPSTGKACSCLNLSPIEHIENAATIYAARATKAELTSFSSLTVKTTFEVLETFKGETNKTETIVSGGGCRMEYMVGRDYLILTDRSDFVSICSGHDYYYPTDFEKHIKHNGILLELRKIQKNNKAQKIDADKQSAL